MVIIFGLLATGTAGRLLDRASRFRPGAAGRGAAVAWWRVEMRELTLSPAEDGMTYIQGRIDAAGGAKPSHPTRNAATAPTRR